MSELRNRTFDEVVHSMPFEKQTLLYYLVGTAIEEPLWELSAILRCLPKAIRACVLSKFTVEESEVLIFLMERAQAEGLHNKLVALTRG